jgi:uncharacterized protein (TIGR02996 family)
MTSEDAFVADILEHPDDDAPRLIFADWLEDRGGQGDVERAEFIRIQCRRASLPSVPEEQLLRRRAEMLLRAHWESWVRPLAELVGKVHSESWLQGPYNTEALYKFRRGFVFVLDLPARRFIEHGVRLLRWAPLRQVRLYGAGEVARELAGCAQLQWLERIDFTDYFSDPIDANAMAALSGSVYLGRLRGLGLYRNNLGDRGLAALSQAKWLAGLHVLELGQNGLSAQGIAALAATPHSFRPVRLLLGNNPLGDEGIAELARSPILSRLTTLSLTGCAVGTAAGDALARCPSLGSLRYLDLGSNPLLQDAGAFALAKAPWLGGLTALHISGYGMSEAGEKALRAALSEGATLTLTP